MKKQISILLMTLLFVGSVFGLDINYTGSDVLSLHNHEVYKLLWNPSTKNPAITWWTLTNVEAAESDQFTNRTNDFRSCDLGSSDKQDYIKTGYDRGHQCPNNDRDYSKDDASLTFLMCNMAPQTPKLNRGLWKKYEKYGHTLAMKHGSIEIACGPIYDSSETPKYIGNAVRVPSSFWKAFFYNGKAEVLIFTQDNSVRKSSLEEVASLTGLEIKE